MISTWSTTIKLPNSDCQHQQGLYHYDWFLRYLKHQLCHNFLITHTHTHLFPAALCLTSAPADISIGVLGVAYSGTPLIAVKQGDGRRIPYLYISTAACVPNIHARTVSHVNAAFVCSSRVYADDWDGLLLWRAVKSFELWASILATKGTTCTLDIQWTKTSGLNQQNGQ